jgi:hypothetical protein
VKDDGTSISSSREWMIQQLPAMLKPVIWHAAHAEAGMEILWSLEAEEARSDHEDTFNPISAIASAASFDNSNLLVSEVVLKWLSTKLVESPAIERVRRQPWLLEKLLKPFFARVVEQRWWTTRTITFRALPVHLERTRPLREKALALAEKFLNSQDSILSSAALPLLEEATRGIESKFRYEPSQEDYERWRVERFKALELAERAAVAHGDSPIFLLRLRCLLWRRAEYDFDEEFAKACETLLSKIPDTFDLRALRALTSSGDDEIHVRPGPDLKDNLEAATKHWDSFVEKVSGEAIIKFNDAKTLFDFLRLQASVVKDTGLSLQPHLFMYKVAMLPGWASPVLHELVNSGDTTFDGCLAMILDVVRSSAQKDYELALRDIPTKGRPEQISAVVRCIANANQSGTISDTERQLLLNIAEGAQGEVTRAIANTTWISFQNEPDWAVQLLSKLKPTTNEDATQVRAALARIVEQHASNVNVQNVQQCIRNLGVFCVADRMHERHFDQLAKRYPKQVYEHLRDLLDSAPEFYLGHIEDVSFGDFDDSEYVKRELQDQWSKALAEGKDEDRRLPLIRSLLWTDPAAIENRVQQILLGCDGVEKLEIAVNLVATQGSRFVFQYPELVRAFLNRAGELGDLDGVRRILWRSACGGGRSFSGSELDPEYHYILEGAEALSKQFANDSVLGPFYRTIVESERREIEFHRRLYRQSEDDE